MGREDLGVRHKTVTLDDETVRILTEYGKGNLSQGIRWAAMMIEEMEGES